MRLALCLFAITTVLLNTASQANEWPMERGDAAGTGYTPDSLGNDLGLLWTLHPRQAPQPAWSGRDTRMAFDETFRPVVADGTLFFGSSADCKIYAIDAASGRERWSFFTDGPIRFAPAVWEDRVFVASDDGYLYCLATSDGRVLWEKRGGPSDEKILGNGRMISKWPARGGPVVADKVVYFAAGIWPSEGIFVYALDVVTGETKWCNDTSGNIYTPQPHGGANAHSGISAQGRLTICDDVLLVPTGRAVPAALRRDTGELLYFHLQRYGQVGGSALAAGDRFFLNGGSVFDVISGASLGHGIDPAVASITPEGIIHVQDAAIISSQFVTQEGTDRKGGQTTRRALAPATVLGRLPIARPTSLIVAGDHIVVGAEGRVTVFDRKAREDVATLAVDGTPLSLAVAQGRLFTATDRGDIYCFGTAPNSRQPAKHLILGGHTQWGNERFRSSSEYVDQVMRFKTITEGYCLDHQCGNGELAIELARKTNLHIIATESDPDCVAAARERAYAAGLYGTRITVIHAAPVETNLPNHFANLIVSARSAVEGVMPMHVSELNDEIGRLIHPAGGWAVFGKLGSRLQGSACGIKRGTGNWTHQYGNAANTTCSDDKVVRGPLGMLWFDDLGFQMPNRHGRGPAPLVLGSRMFIEGLHGVRCVDIYNGRTLWEYTLPGILKENHQEHLMGTAGTGSNLCMTEDALYVCVDDHCLRIDPATGKLLATLQSPAFLQPEPRVWSYVACVGNTLFGTLADTEHLVKYRYGRSSMETQFTESRLLFAMDATTGQMRWRYSPGWSLRNNAIAIADGRVYLIDRPIATMDDARRGDPKKEHELGHLLALDAKTGKELWRVEQGVYGTMLAASEKHDVLLMAYQDTRFKLDSEQGGRMAGFRASDGARLWDIAAQYGSRPIINDQTVFAQPGAWDLLTGRRKDDFVFQRSYGCGILSSSANMLLYRSATLGYSDLTAGADTINYGGIRPGCWINTIPAGGLVLMPDATDVCRCSYLMKASIALQPLPQPVDRDRNVHVRNSLANSRIRFARKKQGHVAFIGGSITEMDGYRPMVCEILRKRFPETEFRFTDAGISSTCSTTGAFRLEEDVLAEGPVDLFFIEFAVNDDQDAGHARRECIRGMEGLIRHTRAHNPMADIVITHFTNPGMVATIQAGDTPISSGSHEDVARHYNVTTIDLAGEVAQRITERTLSWKEFGGTHPAPLGNRICADMIDCAMALAWKEALEPTAKPTPYPMPREPLDLNHYGQGRFLDPANVTLGKGWMKTTPVWAELSGSCRERFADIPLLCSEQPGGELSLEFRGPAIGAYVLAGPDAGILEVTVDKSPPKRFDLYHNFSRALHYPRTVMFDADLSPGQHVARIRLVPREDQSAGGTAARIMRFVANE